MCYLPKLLLYCALSFSFLLLGVTVDKQFRCDYKYHEASDSFYKFHRIPAIWRDARLRCYLEGATLLSSLNKDQNLIMKAMMKENIARDNMSIHTGIQSTFSRGDFFSVEGVHLRNITRVWSDSNPNNWQNIQSCLTFSINGTLQDEACSLAKPYICYRKYDDSMVVNECGTVDNAYSLDARTGSCYKVHKVPRPWSRAYMACYAEGANLLIIDDPQEADVIKELFFKYPKSNVRGLGWKDVTYIGVHDWTSWITVDGKTLEHPNLDDFIIQELNRTPSEFCGYVYRTARLDELWCQKTYSFICEKNPDSLLKCFQE